MRLGELPSSAAMPRLRFPAGAMLCKFAKSGRRLGQAAASAFGLLLPNAMNDEVCM